MLLMLQPWAHWRNRPTATDEKNESLVCFCCDFSAWYSFGKVIKIVATRCHILKLKCTKFHFGWGSAPYPARGDYSAPPDLLPRFKGPTFNGKEGRGRKGGKREVGKA